MSLHMPNAWERTEIIAFKNRAQCLRPSESCSSWSLQPYFRLKARLRKQLVPEGRTLLQITSETLGGRGVALVVLLR